MTPTPDQLKRAAAREALTHVRSGTVLGLGTGSTVRHFLDLLAERLRGGDLTDVVGVPTSRDTEAHAGRLGIPLIELDPDRPPILTVDGADEVSPELDLIKGMGGALLREKMVAQASSRLLVIADESKVVERLGTVSPLPVEVVPWGISMQRAFLEEAGARVRLRTGPDGDAAKSDNGNVFLDCTFDEGIGDPMALDRRLASRAGIVDSGLFLGMADTAVIAGADGVRTIIRPGSGAARAGVGS